MTRSSQAKPSQSVKWERRLALLRLTASLGSITDTLTLTGECAIANDFEVRLRALTDLLKTSACLPACLSVYVA